MCCEPRAITGVAVRRFAPPHKSDTAAFTHTLCTYTLRAVSPSATRVQLPLSDPNFWGPEEAAAAAARSAVKHSTMEKEEEEMDDDDVSRGVDGGKGGGSQIAPSPLSLSLYLPFHQCPTKQSRQRFRVPVSYSKRADKATKTKCRRREHISVLKTPSENDAGKLCYLYVCKGRSFKSGPIPN